MKAQHKKRKAAVLATGFSVAFVVILIGCYGTIHVLQDKTKTGVRLSSESLKRGKIIYSNNCQLCHGENARGDGPDADKWEPKPPDLIKRALHVTSTGLESIIDYPNYSSTAFLRRIRHGKEHMPEFKDILSEKDAEEIIAYLRFLIQKETSIKEVP